MDYFYQTLAHVRIWFSFDNQDGRKNGHLWSVNNCGQSGLVICHPFFSKFHARITIIKLFEYKLCQMHANKIVAKKKKPLLLVCTCGHFDLKVVSPAKHGRHIGIMTVNVVVIVVRVVTLLVIQLITLEGMHFHSNFAKRSIIIKYRSSLKKGVICKILT